MPVYLFTYHGYGTWMPDHPRGYVHRTDGMLPPDEEMARAYRRKQRETEALFTAERQRLLIQTALRAAKHLDAIVHAVSTEPSHVHVLISWKHDRAWEAMRTSLRRQLTQALNRAFGKRKWFSAKGSRKRVLDYEHFDHLTLEYLPKHRGESWFRERDVQAARKRNAHRK